MLLAAAVGHYLEDHAWQAVTNSTWQALEAFDLQSGSDMLLLSVTSEGKQDSWSVHTVDRAVVGL